MLNLLTFRRQPLYAESFVDKKANALSAYYDGYAGKGKYSHTASAMTSAGKTVTAIE